MRGIVVVDMEVRERDVARLGGVTALAARGKVVLVVVVAAVHDERGHHDAEHDELLRSISLFIRKGHFRLRRGPLDP